MRTEIDTEATMGTAITRGAKGARMQSYRKRLPSWMGFPRPAHLLFACAALGLGLGCGSDDDGGEEPPPTGPSTTQVLRVGNAEGSAGGTAQIVLSLESTEPLTGIQFDLLHDPTVLTITDAVTTTRTAGFEVFRADPEAGITRVLLTDLSGAGEVAQGDGPVITITVAIDAGAPLGASEVATSEALATDRSATPVALGSAAGTFTVR